MSGSASMRGRRKKIPKCYAISNMSRNPPTLYVRISIMGAGGGCVNRQKSPTGCSYRDRQRRQRKTITCIVMSLQSPEGRLAYIASRANVGCQIRQTQRCARKGYMLIVIGARTDYVICATERSRRPHHDNIRTNPVGLARLARDGLYGWVVC